MAESDSSENGGRALEIVNPLRKPPRIDIEKYQTDTIPEVGDQEMEA